MQTEGLRESLQTVTNELAELEGH
jgi:chromosome segregation ATPase